MHSKLMAAVASVALLSSPALAADLGNVTYKDNGYDGVPHNAADFTGFYLGGGLGYGASVVSSDANFDGAVDVSGGNGDVGYRWDRLTTGTGHASADLGGYGLTGMLQLGYDRQVGQALLIGVFADYSFYGVSGKGGASFECGGECANAWNNFNYEVEHRLDSAWTLGGRIGVVHNNSLFYVLGGWGQTRWTLDGDIPTGVKDSGDASTWVVGGGIETRIAPSLFLGLEGRAHFLDSQTIYDSTNYTVNGVSAPGCGSPAPARVCTMTHNTAEIDPALYDAKVTLKYKFGAK